jgi:hypothetical protein
LGGAFSNAWLNTIQITSRDGGTTGVTGTNEKVILSAITVDSAAGPFAPTPAPEPGTILLFGTGISGLVLFKMRRSRKV